MGKNFSERPSASSGMGSFAKALSQVGNVVSARLAAPAAATTSRGILQMSKSNKTGLSFRLDSTLCAGHDMQTFGLGTAASLASVERYARFTSSMLHVYGAMECALDASTSPAVNSVWKLYADSLRREAALRADLADVAETLSSVHRASEATRAYVAAIQIAAAADEADKGGRLIGHLYCRCSKS